MTVKELLGRIDSPEISEWIAFYNAEATDQKNIMEREKQMARMKGGISPRIRRRR